MHQQVFLLFLTLLCVKRRFVCSFRTRISIWCPNNCVLCRWCAVCDYGCPGLWPSTPKGQNYFDLVKIKANGVSSGFEKFYAWKFNDFQSSTFLSNIPEDAHFATFKDLTSPQGLNDDEELWNTKWTQNGSKKKPQNRKHDRVVVQKTAVAKIRWILKRFMKLGPQPPTTTITNHDHTAPHQLTTQKNIDIFDLATDANIYCVVSESFPKYYALLVLFRRLKIPEYQRNVFLSPFL